LRPHFRERQPRRDIAFQGIQPAGGVGIVPLEGIGDVDPPRNGVISDPEKGGVAQGLKGTVLGIAVAAGWFVVKLLLNRDGATNRGEEIGTGGSGAEITFKLERSVSRPRLGAEKHAALEPPVAEWPGDIRKQIVRLHGRAPSWQSIQRTQRFGEKHGPKPVQ